MKQFLSITMLSAAAAYIALLPQFYLVYNSSNRYTMGWSAQHRASILLAIGILAALYCLLYSILRGLAFLIGRFSSRFDYRRLVLDLSVWTLTALALRTIMAITYATGKTPLAIATLVDAQWVKSICYFFLPIGLLIFYRKGFENSILMLYKLACAMFVMFFVQSFTWTCFSNESNPEAIPTATQDPQHANGLYIFLFDEWSYKRTFENPEFSLSSMPHLQELLKHAMFFRNAFSPGVLTTASIPRFLFQTDPRIFSYSLLELEWGLQHNDFLPLGLKSIFDLSDDHFKLASGFLLHYDSLLGNQVDCLIPFFDYNRRYTLKERILILLYSQLSFLNKIGLNIYPPVKVLGWTGQEFQARIRPVLNDILPRLPSKTVAFFHMCLPHGPFIFNRDWTPRSKPDIGWDASNVSSYMENIYAMDAVFGDITRILKERGDYDSSLLVFLSDHSWKNDYEGTHPGADNYRDTLRSIDPQPRPPEKHVPLIIKYPGQVRGGEVETPTMTAELHPLFKDYLNSPDRVKQWVASWNEGKESDAQYHPE